MKHFYIEKENFWKLLLISFAILSLLPFTFFFAWLCCLTLIFFLFRKNNSKHQDYIAYNNEVCLSPVDGRVIAIENREQGKYFQKVITLKMAIINPYGLLCPFDSEVESIENGDQVAAESWFAKNIAKSRVDCKIGFKNKLGFKSMLRIQKSPMFGFPKLWIRTGDKASAGACFGVIPYGGKIKIYFPTDISIAVEKGDRLKAGVTIIAGIRG